MWKALIVGGLLLLILLLLPKGVEGEIECIKCLARDVEIRALAYSDSVNAISLKAVHESGEEIYVGSCNAVVQDGRAECIINSSLPKPGKYEIEAEYLSRGKVKGRGKFEITVSPSSVLPPQISNVSIYRIGEGLPAPYSGIRVEGVEVLDSIPSLLCLNASTSCGTCMTRECAEQCGKCEESQFKGRVAVVRFSAMPAPKTQDNPANLVTILFGTAVESSYGFTLLDDWDREHSPSFWSGSHFIGQDDSLVFLLPERSEPAYLLGKKFKRGVLLFLIPVRKSKTIFAVNLSGR